MHRSEAIHQIGLREGWAGRGCLEFVLTRRNCQQESRERAREEENESVGECERGVGRDRERHRERERHRHRDREKIRQNTLWAEILAAELQVFSLT